MSKETDRELRKWMKKRQQARMGGRRALLSLTAGVQIVKTAKPVKAKETR